MNNNTLTAPSAWQLINLLIVKHNNLPIANVDLYLRDFGNLQSSLIVANTTPDNYSPIDWGKDSFHSFLMNRAQLNRDTAYGNAMYDEDDINTLDKAQLYLLAKQNLQLEEDALTTAIMNHDPEELQKATQNIHALNTKIFSEGLNTAYKKAFIDHDFLTKDTDMTFVKGLTPMQLMQLAKGVLQSLRLMQLQNANDYLLEANYHLGLMSNYYQLKSLDGSPINFFDADTWLYKVPGLLASSTQGLLGQAVGIAGSYLATSGAADVAAGATAGAIGGPVGSTIGTGVGVLTALGGAAAAVGANIYSRNLETAAQTYEDYKQKVQDKVAKAGVNTDNVLDYARQQYYQQHGQAATDDDLLWDGLISGNLKSGNTVFDRTALNSLKGLNYDVARNNALSVWDIGEDLLTAAPIGKLTKMARGAVEALPAVKKVVDNPALQKLGLTLSDRIDNVIQFGIDKAPLNLAKLNRRKRLADIAGRLVLTTTGEALEEGVQQMIGDKFSNDDTGDDWLNTKFSPTSIVDNVFDAARSTFAAVTPFDPVYSSDQDFLDNYKGGALNALVLTGLTGGLMGIHNFKQLTKLDKAIGDIYTQLFDAKDFVNRNRAYAKAAKYATLDRIEDAFNGLSKLNIPDLTPDILDQEKQQANRTMAFADRKSIKNFAKNELDIDPKSGDYDTYVALNQYYLNNAKDAADKLAKATSTADASDESKDIMSNFNALLQLKITDNKLPANTDLYSSLVKNYATLNALSQHLDAIQQLANANGVLSLSPLLKENIKTVIDATRSSMAQVTDNIKKLNLQLNTSDSGALDHGIQQLVLLHAEDLSDEYYKNQVGQFLVDSNLSNLELLKMSPYTVTSEQAGSPSAAKDINYTKSKFIKDNIQKYNDTILADNQLEQDIHYNDIGAPTTTNPSDKEVEVRTEPTQTPETVLPAEQLVTQTNSEAKPTENLSISTQTEQPALEQHVELLLEAHTAPVTQSNTPVEQSIHTEKKVSLNAPESLLQGTNHKYNHTQYVKSSTGKQNFFFGEHNNNDPSGHYFKIDYNDSGNGEVNIVDNLHIANIRTLNREFRKSIIHVKDGQDYRLGAQDSSGEYKYNDYTLISPGLVLYDKKDNVFYIKKPIEIQIGDDDFQRSQLTPQQLESLPQDTKFDLHTAHSQVTDAYKLLNNATTDDDKLAALDKISAILQLAKDNGVDLGLPKKTLKVLADALKQIDANKLTKELNAWGANNKIITLDKYQELKAKMKSKLNLLNSGIDPEMLSIGTLIAAYHIEAGARKFADFSKRMVDELGDKVKPFLKSFYQGAKFYPGMEDIKKDMDTEDYVSNYNADIDNSDNTEILPGDKVIVNKATDEENGTPFAGNQFTVTGISEDGLVSGKDGKGMSYSFDKSQLSKVTNPSTEEQTQPIQDALKEVAKPDEKDTVQTTTDQELNKLELPLTSDQLNARATNNYGELASDNNPIATKENPVRDTFSHQLIFVNGGKLNTFTGFETDKEDPVFKHPYASREEAKVNVSRPDFFTKSKIRIVVSPFKYANGKVSDGIYLLFDYKGKVTVGSIRADREFNHQLQNIISQDPRRGEKIAGHLAALRNKIRWLNKFIGNRTDLHIVPINISRTNGRYLVNGQDINSRLINLAEHKYVSVNKVPIFGIPKDPMNIEPADNQHPNGVTVAIAQKDGIMYQGLLLPVKERTDGQPYLVIPADRTPGNAPAFVAVNMKSYAAESKVHQLAIAKLVLNLMLSDHKAKYQGTLVKNGDLLKLLVNSGSSTLKNVQIANENGNTNLANSLSNKTFAIKYNDQKQPVSLQIGKKEFNISDLLVLNGKPVNETAYNLALQLIIDNLGYSLNKDLAWNQHFGDTSSKTNMFRSLYYDAKMSSDPNFKFDIVPGMLSIRPEDLGLKWDGSKFIEDAQHPRGISMLGYMIKNGWIQSDLNAKTPFVDSLVYLDDVKVEDTKAADTQKSTATAEVTPTDKQVEEQSTANVVDEKETTEVAGKAKGDGKTLNDFLNDALTGGRQDDTADEWSDEDMAGAPKVQVNPTLKLINLDNAKEWLNYTLGLNETDDSLRFYDTAIHVTKAGLNVMGLAKNDSILLSKLALEGTLYHEAWHRVSNLLINDKLRNSIFDKIRKEYKNANMSDADVDEILADKFMDYQSSNADLIDYRTTNWFKKVSNFVKTWAKVGNYKLARIYYKINTGKYKNVEVDQNKVQRFKNIYSNGGAPYRINGVDFKYISTYGLKKSIVQSLMSTLLFSSNKYTDIVNIPFDRTKELLDNQLSKFEEAANAEKATVNDKNRYEALKEVSDHFYDVFVPEMKRSLAQLKIDVDEPENEIEQYIKASYEYSKAKNATAKVKYIFLTIPMYRENEKGELVLNPEPLTGLPRFYDPTEATSKILNTLHQCSTLAELHTQLDKLGLVKPFYRDFAKRLSAIYDEATLTLIETLVHSAKNDFATCKISQDPDTKQTTIGIVNNSIDTRSIQLPKIWSSMLFYGMKMFEQRKELTGGYNTYLTDNGNKVITTVRNLYKLISNGLLSADKKYDVKQNGEIKTIDLNTKQGVEFTKDLLVKMLNNIGIMVDKPTINNILLSPNYYNASNLSELQLLNSFVNSSAGSKIGSLRNVFSLLSDVQSTAKKSGNRVTVVDTHYNTASQTLAMELYNGNGFVKFLASLAAKTTTDALETMSLGPNNNKFYAIASNDFVSDRSNELNDRGDEFDRLSKNIYSSSSLVLNQLAKNKNLKISVSTFINFKLDKGLDSGRDYFSITNKEDYIAKMTAVFDNRIIFPTTADKKTFHFLKGVELPAMNTMFNTNKNGRLQIDFGNDYVELFMKYVDSDYLAVKLGMQLVDDTEEGKKGSEWISPEQRIKNYQTPGKMKMKDGTTREIAPNCTRFRFLTGMYYYLDGKLYVVDFNDPMHSPAYNLLKFEDMFYNAPQVVKTQILNQLIQKTVNKELNYAIDSGIISGLRDLNGNVHINSLHNILLDANMIGDTTAEYKANPMRLVANNAESYAVYNAIAKYTMGSIISINEVERLFSGDPAFYKLVYLEGKNPDMSIDKIKRSGALISTGVNNRLDFDVNPIADTYSCAELKDIKVSSIQYKLLRSIFKLGAVKGLFLALDEYFGGHDEDYDTIYNQIEEASKGKDDIVIPEDIDEDIKDKLKAALKSAETKANSYEDDINIADAAVYVSPAFYRNLMRMLGTSWSDKAEFGYNLMTEEGKLYLTPLQEKFIFKHNPELIDEDEKGAYINNPAEKVLDDKLLYSLSLQASMKPLKYVAFGDRVQNNGNGGTSTLIPYYNKMALFPLFKGIATGSIKPLYDRMADLNNPLDMAMFESAVKVGSLNPFQYYSNAEKGEVNDLNNLTVYKQPVKYLKQLLATDAHDHAESMFATQPVKITMSNIRQEDDYGRGEDLKKGSAVVKDVMDAINAISDQGYDKLHNMFFNEDGTLNERTLTNSIREDAENSSADDNILDALTLDENGEPHIPLAALSNNNWLESRMIAMVNKNTIEINMPGIPMIQRSDFGIRNGDGMHVLSDKDMNFGLRLNMMNDDGSMDSICSIGLFKDVIPNYNKLSFLEAKQWLIDNKLIGKDAKAEAIGYRVPTQASASISPLRFVDILPATMNDTIILPDEFTKLTGSDFDIDKLFIARYAYENTPEGISRKTIDSTKPLNKQDSGALLNQILSNFIRILTTPGMEDLLKQSIDTATENVKAVLNDIESNQPFVLSVPFELYTPSYQEDRKFEYTGGKVGIGPMALNNAGHVLALLTGLKFNLLTQNAELMNALGNERLDKIWDLYDGYTTPDRILNWMSAMINAFVDVAKDPYIIRLNVTPYTYNMSTYLLCTGMGKRTFYFLALPILKDLSRAIENTKGKYGVDAFASNSLLKANAIDEVLNKYDSNGSIRTELDNMPHDIYIQKLVDLFDVRGIKNGQPDTILRDMLVNKPDDGRKFNMNLILAYRAFKDLSFYADGLQNLIMVSRVDTKKTGKSMAEQRIYANKLDSVKRDEDHIFDSESLNRFFGDTFLDKKFDNSVGLCWDILKGKMLRTTPAAINFVNSMLYSLGKVDFCMPGTINQMNRSVEASIKSKFFNQYMDEHNMSIDNMLYGKNSIAKLLLDIKNEIYSGEIPGMLNENGEIANDFLKYLLPNINTQDDVQPDYINVSELLSDDAAENNNLINHWQDLLQNDNKRIAQLAKDVAIYAFYTSGDNPGSNTFFKYLPNSFREELGYNKFIKDQLKELNDNENSSIAARDIYLNNWYNDDIVKPINPVEYQLDALTMQTIPYRFTTIDMAGEGNIPILIDGRRNIRSRKYDIRPVAYTKYEMPNHKTVMVPVFAPYIKMHFGDTYAPENTYVYRLTAYRTTKESDKRTHFYPIYALCEKKGTKYKGHSVVEYGTGRTQLKYNKLPDLYAATAHIVSSILGDREGLNEFFKQAQAGSSKYAADLEYERALMLDILSQAKPIQQLINWSNSTEASNFRYDGQVLEGEPSDLENLPTEDSIVDDNDANDYREDTTLDIDALIKNDESFDKLQVEGSLDNVESADEYLNYLKSLGATENEEETNKVIQDYNMLHDNGATENEEDKLDKSVNNQKTYSGKMTFSYSGRLRSDVLSKTTFDAIRNGERTATTRYESDGHINYWKGIKKGDFIDFYDKNNRKTTVLVTKPLSKLSIDTDPEEWSKKEGWNTKYFEDEVKPRINQAYQMEYKALNATKLTNLFSDYNILHDNEDDNNEPFKGC